ncbi:MAG: hypothetical protein EPN33_08210 [Acidobacteria bacterium]|nr:MAG: hypothetical protein EPN33_08210 [Acidobacteriota bacterium]
MAQPPLAVFSCVALLAMLVCSARAQDPADSYDHPAGNVNELTLAGLRPGQSRIAQAEALWGKQWHHPSRDEDDVYVWCDARSHLQLSLEATREGLIRVVTVSRMRPAPAAGGCTAVLGDGAAKTGRGVRLGDSPQRLKHVYGKPFFTGPSSWRGRDVNMVVFNFSWAGTSKPQILESSFAGGKLVKMTLSAEYY